MKNEKKIKILFLGTLTSDEQNKIFLFKGIRPAPADIVQKYLIDGFIEDDRVEEIYFLGSPRISAYPNNKILKVKDEKWTIKKGKVDSLGYFNFPIIGFKEREIKLIKKAKKWVQNQKNSEIYAIIYSMHSPFLAAIKAIKEINPEIKTLLIVPDLPQYMGEFNFIKKILKKLDMIRINKLLSYIDKYALYTKYMAEYLNLQDNWIVFEGLMDTDKISLESFKKVKKNVCVYAGSLDKKYVIGTLIEAFSKIDNAELHLYGKKSEADILINEYKNIKNIKYMGILSQEEIFKVMKDARLLVNPRPSSLELTKYSCPSKTFEYIASGTPVVMNKLAGLPEEYYPYIYFFEEEDVNGFRKKIKDILSKTDEELYDFAKNGKIFLKEYKNNIYQAKKILDFITREDKNNEKK